MNEYIITSSKWIKVSSKSSTNVYNLPSSSLGGKYGGVAIGKLSSSNSSSSSSYSQAY